MCVIFYKRLRTFLLYLVSRGKKKKNSMTLLWLHSALLRVKVGVEAIYPRPFCLTSLTPPRVKSGMTERAARDAVSAHCSVIVTFLQFTTVDISVVILQS